MMEIILLQDVARVGKSGQKVTVKDGHGRNLLIPQGLAIMATRGAGKQVQAQVAARMKAVQVRKEKAETLAKQMEQVHCTVEVSVGEQGKLHGAVTSADIARALAKQGISVDKHQVALERAITVPGDTQVVVRLHPEVKVSIRVSVVPK